MKQTIQSKAKLLILAVLEVVLAIEVLFPKWLIFQINVFYTYSTSASMWRIGKLLNNISDYADLGFWGTLLIILIYALLILSLVGIAITIYSGVCAFTKKGPVYDFGFDIPCALAVFAIAIVAVGNIIISSETDGWIENVLALTGAPIITLIVAVAGILLCRVVPDSVFASLDQQMQGIGVPVGGMSHRPGGVGTPPVGGTYRKPAADGRRCPACGAMCAPNVAFCPTCGTKMPQPLVCGGCGKELVPGTKFCPYCGKPAQAAGNPGVPVAPVAPVTPAAPVTPVVPAPPAAPKPSGEADRFQKSPPL